MQRTPLLEKSKEAKESTSLFDEKESNGCCSCFGIFNSKKETKPKSNKKSDGFFANLFGSEKPRKMGDKDDEIIIDYHVKTSEYRERQEARKARLKVKP